MIIEVVLYDMRDKFSKKISCYDWVEAMHFLSDNHQRSCRVGISVNGSPEVVLSVSDCITLLEVKS